MRDLRALLRGGEVTEHTSGAKYHLSYLREPLTIPIYIAASAPKIIRLAGRIADGVVLLVGTDPMFVSSALDVLGEGARESGRSPDDIHVVLWTPTAIAEDGKRARDLVRAHVARVVIRPLPAPIPEEEMERVEQIRKSYNYYSHMETEAGHAKLVTDSLVECFALAGTPDECRQRLREIVSQRVDQVAIVPFVAPGGDRADTMRLFAEIAQG